MSEQTPPLITLEQLMIRVREHVLRARLKQRMLQGAFWGLVVGVPTLAAERLVNWEPGLFYGLLLPLFGVAAGALWAWLSVPRLDKFARFVDRTLKAQDQIITAWEVGRGQSTNTVEAQLVAMIAKQLEETPLKSIQDDTLPAESRPAAVLAAFLGGLLIFPIFQQMLVPPPAGLLEIRPELDELEKKLEELKKRLPKKEETQKPETETVRKRRQYQEMVEERVRKLLVKMRWSKRPEDAKKFAAEAKQALDDEARTNVDPVDPKTQRFMDALRKGDAEGAAKAAREIAEELRKKSAGGGDSRDEMKKLGQKLKDLARQVEAEKSGTQKWTQYKTEGGAPQEQGEGQQGEGAGGQGQEGQGQSGQDGQSGQGGQDGQGGQSGQGGSGQQGASGQGPGGQGQAGSGGQGQGGSKGDGNGSQDGQGGSTGKGGQSGQGDQPGQGGQSGGNQSGGGGQGQAGAGTKSGGSGQGGQPGGKNADGTQQDGGGAATGKGGQPGGKGGPQAGDPAGKGGQPGDPKDGQGGGAPGDKDGKGGASGTPGDKDGKGAGGDKGGKSGSGGGDKDGKGGDGGSAGKQPDGKGTNGGAKAGSGGGKGGGAGVGGGGGGSNDGDGGSEGRKPDLDGKGGGGSATKGPKLGQGSGTGDKGDEGGGGEGDGDPASEMAAGLDRAAERLAAGDANGAASELEAIDQQLKEIKSGKGKGIGKGKGKGKGAPGQKGAGKGSKGWGTNSAEKVGEGGGDAQGAGAGSTTKGEKAGAEGGGGGGAPNYDPNNVKKGDATKTVRGRVASGKGLKNIKGKATGGGSARAFGKGEGKLPDQAVSKEEAARLKGDFKESMHEYLSQENVPGEYRSLIKDYFSIDEEAKE